MDESVICVCGEEMMYVDFLEEWCCPKCCVNAVKEDGKIYYNY